jgi:hypothetical protein
MYGVLLMGLATAMYLAGVLFAPIRHLIGGGPRLLAINEWIVWYSGVPLVVGLCLAGVDLFVLLRVKRSPRDDVRHDPIHRRAVIVALTAYDDADSIGDAVRDFRAHPAVGAVIVVSNNSRDRIMACAAEAGAIAVNETLWVLRLPVPERGFGAGRLRPCRALRRGPDVPGLRHR